jgi:hypothetical protein
MKIPYSLISLIYFITFILNANPSTAQIRYGPNVGLNFSELPNNTKYIIDQQFYSGYQLGIIAEFKLIDDLFLQPGVLIANKGSKYIVGNNTGGSSTGFSSFQFSSFYADIPINLVYKFNKHSFKLFFNCRTSGRIRINR